MQILVDLQRLGVVTMTDIPNRRDFLICLKNRLDCHSTSTLDSNDITGFSSDSRYIGKEPDVYTGDVQKSASTLDEMDHDSKRDPSLTGTC